jgi:antitoxin component HigA of HigAB toxin-antitoxin module
VKRSTTPSIRQTQSTSSEAERDLSEVVNRKRPLTVAMIVRLREELGISADILIGPHRRAA